MINSLLSFGAKSVNPEILEKTLTGREEIVNEIEKKYVDKTLSSSTMQSLIIATRGSGKTHIIKVLYHRFKRNKKLAKKAVLAYMSEDEVGIANFTDLMVSMLRSFVRYKEPGSEILEDKIGEASLIKETDKREIFVKSILLEFAGNRIIILLIENFDKILSSLGPNGQGSLRDYIHQYNKLSIIATSQNLIASLQDSKNPFYNFFNVYILKKLNFDESVNFLIKIAESEGKKDLIEEMQKSSFEGKLKAIYEITEGNHRLLVTFYSFLKAEYKSELSKIFVKVMNDLKPYYEQFVNVLPAQQQKIVKYLSLNRRAMPGKEVARATFIEPNVFSKQISLLFERGMIDKTKSGKDTYYELKEPLMRICFEISESSDGIAKLFVDFLSCFYDKQHIRNNYLIFKYGAKFQDEEIKQKYAEEANLYEYALDNKDKEKMNFAHDFFNTMINFDDIEDTFKGVEDAFEHFANGESYHKTKEYDKAIKQFKKSLEILPDNEKVTLSIGSSYVKLGKFEEAEKYFRKAIAINPGNINTIISLGAVYLVQKKFEKSVKVFTEVLAKNPKDGHVLFGVGLSHFYMKNYQEAIKYLNNSLKQGEKSIWLYNSLAKSYFILKKYDKAVSVYEKSLKYEPSEEAYYNLGLSLTRTKNYEESVPYLQEAIKLNSLNGDYYSNLGYSYFKLDNYEEAIVNFQKAVQYNSDPKMDYFGLGLSYLLREDYNQAIIYFQKVVEIEPNNVAAIIGLVYCYYDLRKNKFAIKLLKDLIQIVPKDPTIYNLLGLTHLRVNEIELAKGYLKKGLVIDPDNESIKFSYLSIYIRLNDARESTKQLEKLIAEVNNKELVIESLKDDIFYNLFKYGSDEFIKTYFDFALKLFIKEKKEDQFWKAFPEALFEILINIEDYDSERLIKIQNILEKSLSDFEQGIIPLKMFGIGIRYLKKGDKNALFDLSKEERKIFKKAILNEREKNKVELKASEN